MRYFLLVILFLASVTTSWSQQQMIFKAGDRVCFVGNSITFNGGFHHDIFAYYATRFPSQRVDFFNCGVGGDVASGILRRFDSDVLVNKPTVAVLMVGMNDIRRNLYTPTAINNPDTTALKEDALKLYRAKLEEIVRICLDKNIRIILEKPTIYDQTAVMSSFNYYGCNDALKACADFIQTLADKYRLLTVDYWTILNDLNKQLQTKDSTTTIIGHDRVHPGTGGNFAMAYQFITTTGASHDVTNVAISKTYIKSGDAKITGVKYKATGVQFSILEAALPFPYMPEFEAPMKLVPFQEKTGGEWLMITDLPEGVYTLKIDTFEVGKFTNSDLAKGVNLALYRHTPQMQQAIVVYTILQELWKSEADNRIVKQIETGNDFQKFQDKTNLPALTAYLDSMNNARPNPNLTLRKEIAQYAAVKANEQAAFKKMEELKAKVYASNKPLIHTYTLVKN